MESRRFDALAAAFANGCSRRTVGRLAAGGALGGLASLAALVARGDVANAKQDHHRRNRTKASRGERADARSKDHPDDGPRHKHHQHAGEQEPPQSQPGQPQDGSGEHGTARHGKGRKPKPPKPKPCGSSCTNRGGRCCANGSCVAAGQCCPDEKQCRDGSCSESAVCCPEQRRCPNGSCVAADQCCPRERQCANRDCIPTGDCCPEERRCADDSCVAYDECCPDVPPALCDPLQCLVATCDGNASTCSSICQSGEVCCQGGCLTHPCDNGCDLSNDCSRCNQAPTGTTYCAGQDSCVSNQCPSGQQYDDASCQCKPVACPSGSVSCPPVPAMGWPHDGGIVDLPAGCCPSWKFVANAPGWNADICAEPISGGSAWACN